MAWNGLCIFAIHKPFSMSYPNAIEVCRADLFTKEVELYNAIGTLCTRNV